MSFTEANQTWDQPLDGKTRLQGDGQGAFGTARDQLIGGIDDGTKNIFDIQKIALPFFGQQQGAIATPE